MGISLSSGESLSSNSMAETNSAQCREPNPTEISSARPSGHIRYLIVLMLFVVTALNYANRAALSIAGPAAARELGLDPVAMGYVFSAFAWSYVLGQIPGGWLLDRYGSKQVYALSLLSWSIFTCLQGFVGNFSILTPVTAFFVLRLLVGLAESPAFPGNSRIVAEWFPASERGTASAIFNSAQYFATVLFAPLMGWITHSLSWRYSFITIGGLGILMLPVWKRFVHSPKAHPRLGMAELEYIKNGGGLVDIDQPRPSSAETPRLSTITQLLRNRMLLGTYLGQYFITALTYFFITWFPVYLVEGRGMTILTAGFVAALPALCGFGGGILGGVISDLLLRRGHSLTIARKVPIIGGMLLSICIIACNFVKPVWIVIMIMSVAFFGKGIGAMGWAVVSDTSPKQSAGLSGGVFNTFGNLAGITTPIVIGYIVQGTKSFNGALIFIAGNAVAAIICYLLIVGDIRRVDFDYPN